MKDVQERLETQPAGRAAISGVIVFVILTLLASNLSDSPLQQWIARLVEPVRNGLGLDQAWNVFAPDPRSTVLAVEGRIRFDDGTAAVWKPPKGDPVISEYRDYHWQKYMEQVRLDDDSFLWRPLAVWLARRNDGPSRHPVEVTLVRRWFDLNPPGTHPAHGPWNEFAYFTFQVDAAALASESRP